MLTIKNDRCCVIHCKLFKIPLCLSLWLIGIQLGTTNVVFAKGSWVFQEQTQAVTGIVIDETGETVPGVNVYEKGTSNGTYSDADGKFSVVVENKDAILVFSVIGYTLQEVLVGNQTTINVTMVEDIFSLEEVVVIGYGEVKKSDITGSVASVKQEEITAYPAVDMVQAIQGRAAGLQVTANNGAPGAGFKVRIRGGTSINASSDPVYVVDGFVGAALPPPEDIESIEILKDASATAIYGSRGANGVVMVTTKRGQSGKPVINLNMSYSIQNPINRLDLLNAEQFSDYIQETNPNFEPLGNNTDWQDEIFQQGAIQNYQVGVSGGTDNARYYVSGTYFDQDGIISNSSFKRYSLTSNIDIDASERLEVGVNLFARRTQQDGVRTQESSGGSNNTGVVASAFKFGPDQTIRNSNGEYTLARLNDEHDNPVAVLREFVNDNVTDRYQGKIYASYQLVEGLSFRVTLGGSADNARTGTFTPSVLQAGRGVGGDGMINSTKRSLLLNENFLTYTKLMGNHDLNLMGGLFLSIVS